MSPILLQEGRYHRMNDVAHCVALGGFEFFFCLVPFNSFVYLVRTTNN